MSEVTPMWTSAQLAARWGVSPRTVTDMAVRKEVPALRVRDRWRFPEQAILRWEKKHLTGV